MIKNYLYNLATDRKKGIINIPAKAVLFLLSLVYLMAVKVAIFVNSRRPRRFDCKVISVGNITLGGTGKTTLVQFIAAYLKKEGHKVAILSRGYKRKKAASSGRTAGNFETMGDEPYMLSKNLGDIPVIVDADRIRSAERAIKEYGADTLILDDGFQQWRIAKDLEIVTVDALNPFGNRRLLPRGILREPLSSLRRADLFVLTKSDLGSGGKEATEFLDRINPEAQVFLARHKPLGFYDVARPGEPLKESVTGGKVAIFSGIGDPQSFEGLIKGMGLEVGLSFEFSDHHHYTNEDLEKIIRASREKNINTVITTQKDASRLESMRFEPAGVRLLCLRIEMEIEDEQRFYNRLRQLYPL